MGLDILTYTGLRRVIGPTPEQIAKAEERDGFTTFFVNPDFPGRADPIEPDAIYSFDEVTDFRAGSYGSYSRWREWLARVAGVTDLAAFWSAPDFNVPFAEILNFSDCEGTIGPEVSAELAHDFDAHSEKAHATPAGDAETHAYFLRTYDRFRTAFRAAAGSGAVRFC